MCPTYCNIQCTCVTHIYRIAGNFRGIQFSQFSRLTGKPRKLNPRNKILNAHSRYSDRPSSKIRSRNLCIQPLLENWIPRKFSTIWYNIYDLPLTFYFRDDQCNCRRRREYTEHTYVADPGGCRGRGRGLAVASVLYAGLLLLLLLCREE